MDAGQAQALDDFLRGALRGELDTQVRLQDQSDELRGDIDHLAGRVGWAVTDHQEREIERLHRLGLSANLIALVTGRSLNTIKTRTQQLPPPDTTVGLDGRRRRRPRNGAATPGSGSTVHRDMVSPNGHGENRREGDAAAVVEKGGARPGSVPSDSDPGQRGAA